MKICGLMGKICEGYGKLFSFKFGMKPKKWIKLTFMNFVYKLDSIGTLVLSLLYVFI